MPEGGSQAIYRRVSSCLDAGKLRVSEHYSLRPRTAVCNYPRPPCPTQFAQAVSGVHLDPVLDPILGLLRHTDHRLRVST